MARRKLPRAFAPALDAATLDPAEIVYDQTHKRARLGSGEVGGKDLLTEDDIDGLSLKALGAVGDGATDDTAVIAAALAASANRVVKLTGNSARFLTSTSTYGYLNCRFEGGGQLVMGGKGQARNRAFITNEVADPDYSALENYFDGDWSKQIATNFTFVSANVGATPITQYRLMDRAAQHSSIFVNAGGRNTQPDNQSGGRTGMFRESVRLFQGGQGDLMGRFTFAQVYSTRAGAAHFLSNPAASLNGADLEALVDGAYLQLHEINFNDKGNAIAVANVINYHRDNDGTALHQVWVHDRVQSVGTESIDVVFSPAGKIKRILDTAGADLGADGAAIAMKAGEYIYGNATAVADPAGIKFYSQTLGAAKFGHDGESWIVDGGLSFASGPSATRRTSLVEAAEWYAPESFAAPGVTLGPAVDCAPAIMAALAAAAADGKAGVLLGAKTYGIGKSGMSTADPDKGVGLLLADMTGVTLRGRGKNSILKRIQDLDYHVIEVMRATDASIENMTIDGNKTALPGTGVELNDCHCFSLNSGSTGSVTNFRYSRIWHRDSQGYGAGLQFGNYRNVVLEDLDFDGTDWDAIDIKHRAAAPGPFFSKGIEINRLSARNFGRSKLDNDQVAFDLRGPIIGHGFFAEDGGPCAKAGLRQRGGITGDSSFGAQKSQISGVHVKRNGSGYTAINYGILAQADLASVKGVAEGFTHGAAIDVVGVATKVQGIEVDIAAESCTYGVRVFASGEGNSITVRSKTCDYAVYCEGDKNNINVIGIDSAQNHIRFVTGANDNTVVGKQYVGATPGGTGGNFRNDGTGNVGM